MDGRSGQIVRVSAKPHLLGQGGKKAQICVAAGTIPRGRMWLRRIGRSGSAISPMSWCPFVPSVHR
jgi:hypothetical protein